MLVRSRLAFSTLLLGVFAVACSATDAGSKAPRDKNDGNGGGSGLPDDVFDDDDYVDDDTLTEDSACASVKRTGELVPLDMYVMLDKSASMEGGKWMSVTKALKDFVDSTASHGIGMGIQYYPLPYSTPPPPPPTTWAVEADCGDYGPCVFGQCLGGVTAGLTNDSCESGDYKKPSVAIQLLPLASSAIKSSIDSAKPTGDSTTTYPALEGAHQYAAEWAKAHPGHVTVVVLATDGDPNNCGSKNSTSNIATLAEQAFKANPSVATFVIGVGNEFSSDLHVIAAAGGTDQAIFVDGGKSQEFLDALNHIRGSVACEYQIPIPEDGKEADHDRVNVNITSDGKTETIGRVAAASECDPVKGGWYYDNPKNPSKILLCTKSCEVVKYGSQMSPVQVDVLLGCKSKIW